MCHSCIFIVFLIQCIVICSIISWNVCAGCMCLSSTLVCNVTLFLSHCGNLLLRSIGRCQVIYKVCMSSGRNQSLNFRKNIEVGYTVKQLPPRMKTNNVDNKATKINVLTVFFSLPFYAHNTIMKCLHVL